MKRFTVDVQFNDEGRSPMEQVVTLLEVLTGLGHAVERGIVDGHVSDKQGHAKGTFSITKIKPHNSLI